MRVRAVEWRPADGSGWAFVAPAQLSPSIVSISHRVHAGIDSPADLASALPGDRKLIGPGEDQLTIVFGDAWGGIERDEMEQWWSAVFPDLENPEEIAEAMREWDSEDLVLASFPEQSWNLFRLRVAVPLGEPEGQINEWAHGNIVVLGRALLVFWFQDSENLVRATSGIDARARRGSYTGEPPGESAAELASRYVTEAVRMIGNGASDAVKEVEYWEIWLFDSIDGSGADGTSLGLPQLAELKIWAIGLRENLDDVNGQIYKGQFRAHWSNESLDPIDESVDRELGRARAAVSRFRSDVSDAFEAANSVAIARQLAASQAQQKRADRLEGVVTRLTAFLLVPTLVAAIFGSNVQLPGHGWTRTLIMLVAMVAGAAATFAVLRRWDKL